MYSSQICAIERIPAPTDHTFETVERKGAGHPDTLADLVAELFCSYYARYCAEQFEFVPNHSADKVTLAGADAVVHLGGFDVVTPIGAYYFGKVTNSVGGLTIPVADMFAEAVKVGLVAGTRSEAILAHTEICVRAVEGKPVDHHPGYYSPDSRAQLKSILTTERVANDTVACVAFAGHTPAERLGLKLEQFMQSEAFAAEIPGTGSDIKVMVTRQERRFGVTANLPFHPEAIDSWDQYEELVAHAHELILDAISEELGDEADETALFFNGRDVPGRGYLAPFGTCLGKGDIGAVGRGNRHGGLITPNRGMSIEAPAGKNLMHHTGKVYTVLAQWIADGLYSRFEVASEVVVTSRVGHRLDRPGCVAIRVTGGDAGTDEIEDLVAEYVANAEDVADFLLRHDPLTCSSYSRAHLESVTPERAADSRVIREDSGR